MKLKQESLREVSFPVGGIGAGCIGVAGNGRLTDWEIFNEAGKGRDNGYTHFAVRAERNGKVESVRILNGDLTSDLIGMRVKPEAMFTGYGWGPTHSTLCTLPHFRNCEFDGEFPCAELTFSDPEFPGTVKMNAWSSFCPGHSDRSSLPAAVFEITFENPYDTVCHYTGLCALTNPWNNEKARNTFVKAGNVSQLVLGSNLDPDALEYGELAVSTDADDADVQEYWYRGGWHDDLDVYWTELNTPGRLVSRHYDSPRIHAKNDTGVLAAHVSLKPGEKKTVRFIISWYIPNRTNDWNSPTEDALKRAGLKENRWKNYYTKLCSGAADAAAKLFKDYGEIRKQVFLFCETLHRSTLPEASVQGAAANLAVLISPVCLRCEDGTFWGWEGVGPKLGSCEGTCQHVWNYAQALSLLFPDLERTIRESHAKYGIDENGGWHFRLALPLGIKAQTDWMRPCVDGSFGEIMKLYRDWKISGDTEWLKSLWPLVKPAIEYAWSPENPDKWDPEQTGVITGRQHHTLDVELFGPSGWLNGHYLGALKAAMEMAPVCGDPEFGELCGKIFEKGVKWSEENLFNGEYYKQAVDFKDQNVLAPYMQNGETLDENAYWDSEHRQIKYQIGDGCGIDAHLGQWYASLYGIGQIFDPDRIRTTLKSIYKYNYLPSMRNFANTWRKFALNDESGCIMFSWPEKYERPLIPIPYYPEVMTGFEWAAAAHMVMVGETKKGGELAKAIRNRYDGAKRNPWSEIECGSNYARSMASYAMLQAYSGFRYDMVRGMIGFNPVLKGDFRCFWSLGTVWGEYEKTDGIRKIRILHGSAVFSSFRMNAETVLLNKKECPGSMEQNEWFLESPVTVREGDEITFY